MKWGCFGIVHIATLVLAVVIIAGLYFALRRASRKAQTIVLGILSFSGIAAIIYNLVTWGSPIEYLPLHLCSINAILLPIVVFFGIFQIVSLKLDKRHLVKILIGLVYTYAGLVLFLTGANVGFMPTGSYLGNVLAGEWYRYLLIPIGAIIGFFIVKAEPAVYVLNHQVEDMTDGAISAKAMGTSLSVGVAASVALAMTRVLTGIPILYFLIPGYAIAIGLSFFVPKIFTAIAFDSGGVASGPMTATFLLPLAQGACVAVGGNLVADAFGVVAMVAMTPLITIQVLGMVHQIKNRKRIATVSPLSTLDEDAIIEL